MHKLYNKVCDAIKTLEDSDRVNIMDNSDRRIVAELIDLKKNMLKVERLEMEIDGEYAERRHYVKGHYSNDWIPPMIRKRDGMGRYSSGRDDMMEHLYAMESLAETDMERDKIRRFREQMDQH